MSRKVSIVTINRDGLCRNSTKNIKQILDKVCRFVNIILKTVKVNVTMSIYRDFIHFRLCQWSWLGRN